LTDQFKRVEKMDEQAVALVDTLTELMAGRPIDVALDALATAAGKFIVEEADFTEAEIEHELLSARRFILDAIRQVVPPTRLDRLRFALYLASCLTLMTPVINYTEDRR